MLLTQTDRGECRVAARHREDDVTRENFHGTTLARRSHGALWKRGACHLAAAIAMLGLGIPSHAQDLSDTPLLPENSFFGKKKDIPYVYGQLNKGFLVHGDGQSTEVYPLVDNDNSSSRIGVAYDGRWSEQLAVFANVEAEWRPYSTANVNQNNSGDVDWGEFDLRKLEVRFDLSGFGRFWIGQGGMASDGSAEQDLSGVTVVASSDVADSAAGQLFAFDGAPGLSKIKIGSAFGNLDGISRRARVRYDTPAFHGLRLQTSAGIDALGGDHDVEWDVGATYSHNDDTSPFALEAAFAYAKPRGTDNRISASASGLHKSSGLSLTLAGGYDEKAKISSRPFYIYGKLGYSPDLTALGPTAFAVDGYFGNDFSANGSDSVSFGIAAVQTIKMKDSTFDVYGTVRFYSYDNRAASYEDALSFLTGVRWKF